MKVQRVKLQRVKLQRVKVSEGEQKAQHSRAVQSNFGDQVNQRYLSMAA